MHFIILNLSVVSAIHHSKCLVSILVCQILNAYLCYLLIITSGLYFDWFLCFISKFSDMVFSEQYLRTDLVKAVPDDHKKFLADLVWVHEEVRLVLFALILYF